LLPALPPAWPEGQVVGLRARGGVTVGLRWQDGRVREVELVVPSARTVKVRCASPLQIVGAEPTRDTQLATDESGLTLVEVPVPGTYALRALL